MTPTPSRGAGRVLEVLSLFGEVEWARLNVGSDHNDQGTLPIVVWRFKDPTATGCRQLAEDLSSKMRSKWVFNNGGRNWVLWPKELADEFATGRWRTDTEAALALARSDRELAERLLTEFWDLIGELEGEDA